MKVSEFWHNGRGPQRPQNIKNLQVGNFCNSFKYFLNFSTLRSNFTKKYQGGDFEICGVIDQVDHGESISGRPPARSLTPVPKISAALQTT